MHRRVPSARCSAIRRGGRGLSGRLAFPLPPGSAHGVHALRRFAPASGGVRISASPGPPACCAATPDPIDFRRIDSPPVKLRAQTGRRILGDVALASGLFVQRSGLPSAIRAAGDRSRPFLPWALPLSGLRTPSCASAWARPRTDHQSPAGRLLRKQWVDQSAPGLREIRSFLLRLPFSVLMRLMPDRSRRLQAAVTRQPV